MIKRMLISFISISLLVYIGLGILFYLGQSRFIYYPTPPQNLQGLNSLSLQSDGATLELVVINPNQPEAVIYFGGNAEPVTFNAALFNQAIPNRSVYLVHYRGYGRSSGEPSEKALYADALAIFDQLKSKHRAISVIGRSLGSAVATYLAANRPIRQLLLVTPFDSFERLAKHHYPIYPASLLLREKYRAIDSAPEVQAQTLLFVAEHDRITPPALAHELANALPDDRTTVLTLAKTGHNTISAHPDYQLKIADFFRQ